MACTSLSTGHTLAEVVEGPTAHVLSFEIKHSSSCKHTPINVYNQISIIIPWGGMKKKIEIREQRLPSYKESAWVHNLLY